MLRFQSHLQIDNLPDEQLQNQFEVIMPTLNLSDDTFSSSIGQRDDHGNPIGLLGKAADFVVNTANAMTSYTPIVEEIVFGTRAFKTETRRLRTGWINIPSDIENYHDVSITMFCSAGMLTQLYLAKWKGLIFNEEGEYFYPMNNYKKNIEVFFYGPGNIIGAMEPVAHWTLKGCFPTLQQDFKLSYDKNERLRMTQTFKVDKVVSKAATAKKAITAELVTSPTSVVDALTNKVFGKGTSTYSVEDTY
jgi:hypothetical protein